MAQPGYAADTMLHRTVLGGRGGRIIGSNPQLGFTQGGSPWSTVCIVQAGGKLKRRLCQWETLRTQRAPPAPSRRGEIPNLHCFKFEGKLSRTRRLESRALKQSNKTSSFFSQKLFDSREKLS